MIHQKKKRILYAGDYCFAKADIHLHTLLGSCISITLWHPHCLIGGMCHFALSRPSPRRPGSKIDPRYAEDCIELFKRSVKKSGTYLQDYQVKIFGGGNMYQKRISSHLDDIENQPIGEKNTIAAFNLLTQEGLEIKVAHIGEYGYRRIVFDVSTGDVWVKFSPIAGAVGDVRSLNGRN